MGILITVVTVSYNSIKTISDTLDAVAIQTHPNIEHLIIDGSSKDGTVEVVRSHANRQIKLISEPDRGIYHAMNKSLALAKGEVVGFLNSDDIYANNEVLTRIADAFKDPLVDACYGDLVYVNQDNSRIVRCWNSRPFRKGDFAKGWCPAHPTFYVRKSVVNKLGFFDTSYTLASDVEFMMRYLECGHVYARYIPQVLVRMRLGGATNQSWANVIRQNKQIFSALRKNGIRFSRILFIINKLINRIIQFILGHARRYK